MNIDETGTFPRSLEHLSASRPVPALLVAFAGGEIEKRQFPISDTLPIGRWVDSGISLMDGNVSRRHAVVARTAEGFTIEDLGSKNHTFLNGVEVEKLENLTDQDVIRIGNSILVFCEDASRLGESDSNLKYGIIGDFHGPALVEEISRGVFSMRDILIAGPTGTGKELAANAYAAMVRKEIFVQNAALYAAEEEAISSLFGVAKGVFTNVDPRRGTIEKADGNILFIDEAHMLTRRVQKSLLRIIEDKKLVQVGRTEPRKVDVRFLLASNRDDETFGLAKDLAARLLTVPLPPLTERRADIPSIFDAMLKKSLQDKDLPVEPMMYLLNSIHYEKLMLHGFINENVRGLINIADNIASLVAMGKDAGAAITGVFSDTFGTPTEPSNVSSEKAPAERMTQEIAPPETLEEWRLTLIQEAFTECGSNVSHIQKLLRERGHRFSRSTIAKALDTLSLDRVKKPRKQ